MRDKQSLRGVPPAGTTKQSIWIATARFAGLAMTRQVERVDLNALEASWGQAAPPQSNPPAHA